MRLFGKKIRLRRKALKRGDPSRVLTYHVGRSPVSIGRFTYGHEYITVKQWGEGAALRVGAFCSISDSVVVMLGGNHRTDWITTFPFGHVFEEALGPDRPKGHPATNGDVVIGNDVWIGRNTTILSGVTVGDGAVIAANSTVAKDIGPYEIWGGNPARLIRRRFDDQTIAALLALRWWDWDLDRIRAAVPVLSGAPTPDALRALQQDDMRHP